MRMVYAQAVETSVDEQTWRWLWSHAAYQIVSALASSLRYERVSTGIGWGLRDPANPRRALLVHPAADQRSVGDLALTVLGSGTHVVPRAGRGYVEYIEAVIDIVETVARIYLADPT